LKKLSNKGKYFLEILVLTSALIIACLFWNSPFIFPIKLFVVLLHESSHAIMTFLTGGSVTGIDVNFQIGGSCVSKDGNPALIACSGYLGSIILGGILFYSSTDQKMNRIVFNIFAVLFVILLAFVKGNFSIFFVLFIVLFLIASPRLLPSHAQLIVTSVLGSLSLLYAVIDMQQDLFQDGYHQTDAEIMSATAGLPALFWSILWMAIAFVILYFLLKKKFKIKW
jgi:hypothetical protein